ncbi:hypothetical protein IAU60_003437 [Kwoniella sp. DSM 27419]
MDDDEVPQLLEVSPPSAEAGPSSPRALDAFDRPKIPITLLTGYLGAGKSTLLNYILTADHGYRIAVCMNDFGDTTDIEAKALTLSDPTSSTTSTEFLSLPNGCLCCSVKDMGIAAIEEMVANAPSGVDWVLVELTGVADPGPIVRSFWRNEEMGDLVLDGVVCVVDSRNVLKQLAEPRERGEINEAQKQVACADVILLNKMDLVNPEQVAEVERTIRSLNPTLRVYHTTQSRMPLEGMFNLRAFSDPAALAEPGTSAVASEKGTVTDAQRDCCNDEPHSHAHAHAESENSHLNGITTALIPLPPLATDQWARFNTFIESVLWEGQYPSNSDLAGQTAPEILRTKGYIQLDDGRAHVLQGVADLFEMKELRKAAQESQAEVTGKVVFIGRDVGEGLSAALRQYVGV